MDIQQIKMPPREAAERYAAFQAIEIAWRNYRERILSEYEAAYPKWGKGGRQEKREWENYFRRQEVIEGFRSAFYAGALAMFHKVMDASAAVDKDAAIAKLDLLRRELEELFVHRKQ